MNRGVIIDNGSASTLPSPSHRHHLSGGLLDREHLIAAVQILLPVNGANEPNESPFFAEVGLYRLNGAGIGLMPANERLFFPGELERESGVETGPYFWSLVALRGLLRILINVSFLE